MNRNADDIARRYEELADAHNQLLDLNDEKNKAIERLKAALRAAGMRPEMVDAIALNEVARLNDAHNVQPPEAGKTTQSDGPVSSDALAGGSE